VQPLVIAAAVTGGTYGPEDSPHLPITVEQIAASAVAACRAGAAVVHLHVRDDEGRPVHDGERYRRACALIRAECDALINLTTDLRHEGGLVALEAKPELVSLPCGSSNLGEAALVVTPARLREVAALVRRARVKPELEIFHEGMIGAAEALERDGLLEEPRVYGLQLGMAGSAPADARTLLRLVEQLPAGAPWSVFGVGAAGPAMAVLAIVLGGHVTVGLEGQLHYRDGELATSNAQLVARVVRLAEELGRPVATPTQARRTLGLRARRARRAPATKEGR
jgi:3-keto-5-aminohexanoate cleavage enzyme